MTVAKHHPLCQGNCKNAFCQGVLPDNEITIVRPPSGDPEAEPNEYWLLLCTLYGLCWSPCHWYEKEIKIPISIGSLCLSEIHASTQDLSTFPMIPMPLPQSIPSSHLDCTPTTLSTSPKIQQLKTYFATFLVNIAKLILWASWSGS